MRAAALAIGCLLAATSAAAQVTTATVYGIVVDASSAALPGATVAMRNEGTGAGMTKTTDGSAQTCSMRSTASTTRTS